MLAALPDVTCALQKSRALCNFVGAALQQLSKQEATKTSTAALMLRPQQGPHMLRKQSILGHARCKQHGHEHMKSGQLVIHSCHAYWRFLVTTVLLPCYRWFLVTTVLLRCMTQPLKGDSLAYHGQQRSVPIAWFEDVLSGSKLRQTVRPACACIQVIQQSIR